MARIRCFSNGAPSDSVKIREKQTKRKKGKKNIQMFTVEKRWFHRAFFPPLETTTNTRERSFLDKKKKEKKNTRCINYHRSSIIGFIKLRNDPCSTRNFPCHNWREGKLAKRRVSNCSLPTTLSSANISLFRVSLKVWKCGALTSESRFANIRERENDGRREDYAGMKRLSRGFEGVASSGECVASERKSNYPLTFPPPPPPPLLFVILFAALTEPSF